MTHDDAMIERVARAIYEANPTVWVETREPTTMPSPAYEWVRRPIPWDELDTTVPQEVGAADEAREAARAALSALPERELLREALSALQVFETMAHTYDCDDDEDGKPEVPDNRRLRIEETNGDLSVSIVDVGDFRRARAAADKIRAALGGG